MTSGGARARSGPPKNPNSRTSERAGYTLMSLPNSGYDGKPPRFPLADYRIENITNDDGRVYDEEGSQSFKRRERKLWRELWKTSQACAWSLPQYQYMVYDVAMYCRLMVISETSTAKAADRALIPRYADRIGMSAAGLASLGWKIAPDEFAQRRMERDITEQQANGDGMTVRKRRLRAS